MTPITTYINQNRKLFVASGILATILAIIAASTGVFANIPNSTSGYYDGCRDNSTGALKVIDTQNSETCSQSETAVSWPSSTPAIAYANVGDTSGTLTGYTSSEVTSATVTTQEGNGYYQICFQLTFEPKFGEAGWYQGEQMLHVVGRGGTSNDQSAIDGMCGNTYEAVATDIQSLENTKFIFFR